MTYFDPQSCAHDDCCSRRDFIRISAAGITAAAIPSLPKTLLAATDSTPENLVVKLYESLTPKQKEEICFDWDHSDDRGLLRTHVSNNWNITEEEFAVGGKFFNSDQQEMIHELFFSLYQPDWRKRIEQQLQDDAGGYGKKQTIAIFGKPGQDKFELVMTGRHLTIRCDGNTTPHVAFGGPIFYGHAAKDFNESAKHEGNVFWPQAQKANALFQMLDGKQRKQALIAKAPSESKVEFAKPGAQTSGLPISELSADQRAHAQSVLEALLEPYRNIDREEAKACLSKQGGLEKCRISFFQEGDIGNDQVWDIWRLEGPSFVWHYRGSPHVHVWVNIADDASVPLNARG
ncbi:MAG: DUF3500 domain-containing protein [Planctomycetales bacterium]